MRDDSAAMLFQSFLHQALVGSSGMGRDVVHPAFLLPTTASPTLKGALKDGFGEAVVASDMIKPCKFPSLNKEKTDFQNENELTQNKVRSVVCVSVELAS